MAGNYAANGPISEPARHDDIIADAGSGGIAFSVSLGIYIPTTQTDDDEILEPPLPIPDQDVVQL